MPRLIKEIGAEIIEEWKSPAPAALSCLKAMLQLSTIKDKGVDNSSARTLVNYFLENSAGYTGDRAKDHKRELRDLMKAAPDAERHHRERVLLHLSGYNSTGRIASETQYKTANHSGSNGVYRRITDDGFWLICRRDGRQFWKGWIKRGQFHGGEYWAVSDRAYTLPSVMEALEQLLETIRASDAEKAA